MSPSFTSKGGFRLAINGVVVLRQHGQLEASWDRQQLATHMLRRFQEYANKVPAALTVHLVTCRLSPGEQSVRR